MNNFQYIAEQVGRMPRPELCAFLKREGVVQHKAAKFRPKKVDAAIDFLLANNVVYAKEWNHLKRTYFSRLGDTIHTERDVDEDLLLDMSTEETEAVDKVFNKSDELSGVESEYVLYHTEKDASISREDHIRLNLDVDQNRDAEMKKGTLRVPRAKGESLVHPSKDSSFYEKCFPCLFPYGLGGPNTGWGNKASDKHNIKFDKFVKLLIQRGGNSDMRRFGKYVPFNIALYSYRMKKIAGGVAYIASLNVEASGHSAIGPTGNGGDANGSDSTLFAQIQTAPDAKSIMDALQANNGNLANRILRRLEPYAERLAGSPAFIMHERKLLYAMLGSSVVREEAEPAIFSTISPNDRFYPELPDILARDIDTDSNRDHVSKNAEGDRIYTKQERVQMLRDHPVLAARLFEIRSRLLFEKIFCGEDNPLGKLSDWWMRLEFQGNISLSTIFFRLHRQ